MKRIRMFASAAGPALTVVLALPVAPHAAEPPAEKREPLAVEAFSGNTVMFDLTGAYHNVTVTVVGPWNYHAEAFAKKGVPPIELERYGKVLDGLYHYELTAASSGKLVEVRPGLNNGRGQAPRTRQYQAAELTGSFRVEDGKILPRDDTPEEESKPDQAPQAENGEAKQ
jgi:hypothetical protein